MLIEDAGCSEEDSEQEKAQFLFNRIQISQETYSIYA